MENINNPMLDDNDEEYEYLLNRNFLQDKLGGKTAPTAPNNTAPTNTPNPIILPDAEVEYIPPAVKKVNLPDAVDYDGNELLDGFIPPREVDDYNYRNVKVDDYDSGRGVRSNPEAHPDTYSGSLDSLENLDNAENELIFDEDVLEGFNVGSEEPKLTDDDLEVFPGFYSSDGDDNIEDILDSISNGLLDGEEVDGDEDEDNALTVAGSSVDDDGFSPFSNDIYYIEEVDEETQAINNFDLDAVLDYAIGLGASDLHITGDDYISLTINTNIQRVKKFGIIPPKLTRRLMDQIISNVLEAEFTDELELDTSYVIRTGNSRGRRSRLNVAKSLNNVVMTFRIVSDVIPKPDQLGISKVMQDWVKLPSGLILVNGSTGTGKTTTIASLLNEVNLEERKKIVTVENPVEFLYSNEGKGLVWQREIGKDARSFTKALNSAMRQNPDIILIGEVRDRVEIDALIRSAESGHLAVSTMHTSSAPMTISRIMSLYVGDEQSRILGTLSDVTRGLANQNLVKRIDGKGVIAVREVLPITPEVSEMIRLGDISGIRQYQIDNKITMEHELIKEVSRGLVAPSEARLHSAYPTFFDDLMNTVD